MKHLDLFSGIGGAALAVDTVWPGSEHTFVEIDPFCQAVLKKHWPEAEMHGDINDYIQELIGCDVALPEMPPRMAQNKQSEKIDERPFILTAGTPCQPASQAGRRNGTADDRWLWPHTFAVIRATQPRWCILENVGGLLTLEQGVVFKELLATLEDQGYSWECFVVPACAVNAPHRRDRVWIVARHTDGNGHTGGNEKINATEGRQSPLDNLAGRHSENSDDAPDAANKGLERSAGASIKNGSDGRTSESGRDSWNENWLEVATRLCTLDDGLPNGLARPRGWRNAALKGAGNAWVPQVAIEIMKGIKEVEEKML